MCVLSAAARGMGLWRKIMENLLQPAFEPADFVPERGSAAFSAMRPDGEAPLPFPISESFMRAARAAWRRTGRRP